MFVSLGSVNWAGMLSSVLYWVGWGLFLCLFFGGLAAVLYYFGFKYKMTVFPLFGGGNGNYSVGKPFTNRCKWNSKKNAFVLLFPLFKNKEIKPHEPNTIYPGNTLYAYKVDDQYYPGRISVGQNILGKPSVEMTPVPVHIRNWQSIQYKKNKLEFSSEGFWEENKYFIMVIVTAAICLGIVALTVYWTYTFASGGQNSINGLTQAIRGMGNIPGRAPM